MLFAHRGCCRKESSENTVQSCTESLQKGFSIEVDVRVSKDSVLVCIHDETLFRTHGSRQRVKAMRAEELEKLGVPRLGTILDAIIHFPKSCIMLDLKVRPTSGLLFVAEALCNERRISLSRVSAIVWPSASSFFPATNPPGIFHANTSIKLHLGLESVPKRLSSCVGAVTIPAYGQRDIEKIELLSREYTGLKCNVYCESSVFKKAFPRLGAAASYTTTF